LKREGLDGQNLNESERVGKAPTGVIKTERAKIERNSAYSVYTEINLVVYIPGVKERDQKINNEGKQGAVYRVEGEKGGRATSPKKEERSITLESYGPISKSKKNLSRQSGLENRNLFRGVKGRPTVRGRKILYCRNSGKSNMNGWGEGRD